MSANIIKTCGSPKKKEPSFVHNHSSLRLLTYMTPNMSMEIFDLFQAYLEEELVLKCSLSHESRWTGPPPGLQDPLTADEADIVLMSTKDYMRMKEEGNLHMDLCRAAPVYNHANVKKRPVYFADLYVHKDNAGRLKDLEKMRGSRWVYSEDMSLSGHLMMLRELKKHGHNVKFFSDVKKSGSHRASIEMVRSRTADVTSIASTAMTSYQFDFPERSRELHLVYSLGTLPIYPIVLNSRMSPELRERISQAFLNFTKDPKWGQRLLQHGILQFTEVDEKSYKTVHALRASVQDLLNSTAYY